MKKNNILILLYILIFTMLLGGIMGIIKGLVPNMTTLSFHHLLGMGGTFKNDDIPLYAVLYGIFMATFEIISSILLLNKKRIALKFTLITLSINALGCIISIFLGDIFAISSLLFRFFGIFILIRVDYLSLNKP